MEGQEDQTVGKLGQKLFLQPGMRTLKASAIVCRIRDATGLQEKGNDRARGRRLAQGA